MAGTIVVDRIESDSSYTSTINVASKVNFSGGLQIGGQDTTFAGMRNRIINGGMNFSQRFGNTATSTSSSAGAYVLDRWKYYVNGGGVFTVQQVTDAPTGFTNSQKVTVATADGTISTNDYYILEQRIEGSNFADMAWGTASASSATLSFWVKSSVTGSFGCSFVDAAGGSNYTSYTASYTINQANTWEYKTIVVPGPTTGTWPTSSGTYGVQVCFDLGCGSYYNTPNNVWTGSKEAYSQTSNVKLVSTVNATIQFTGVQFEKGSIATPFEFRDVASELAKCQRYCYVTRNSKTNSNAYLGIGAAANATTSRVHYSLPVELLRPTTLFTVSSVGHYYYNSMGPGGGTCTSIGLDTADERHNRLLVGGMASMVAGDAGEFYSQNAGAYLIFEADL